MNLLDNPTQSNYKVLRVEGASDKQVVEAFLTAGENAGYWFNWQSQLKVEHGNKEGGGIGQIFKDLRNSQHQIWGLIDRDWRSEADIKALQTRYPTLFVLPRVTIENYLIDPDELTQLLPAVTTHSHLQLRERIEATLPQWVNYGALRQILYQRGADRFCDDEQGFPSLLYKRPYEVDDIRDILQKWQDELSPPKILQEYQQQVIIFQNLTPPLLYHHVVYGKYFLEQVIYPTLNKLLGQASHKDWFNRLVFSIKTQGGCPADLIPIFKKLLS